MVAVVLVVVALFTLGSPGTPKLSLEPPSFDGEAAYADLKTIVEDFPQRVAGSDPDNRMGIWVEQQFRAAGLETHIDGFAATVNGKDVALQNVWGVAKGTTQGTIMVIANRDVAAAGHAGRERQRLRRGGHARARGAFTVTAHERTIIFLCTTGDAYGALGARQFVEAPRRDDCTPSSPCATSPSATATASAWTAGARAPRRRRRGCGCWRRRPAKRDANLDADAAQPCRPGAAPGRARPSAGSQGPFVAAGVPAITITAAGASVPAQNGHARQRVRRRRSPRWARRPRTW